MGPLWESGELIDQVPGLLAHPLAVGLLDDPHDLHLPRGVVDAHQSHVPGEPGEGVNFVRKEIDSGQGFPVGFQEL